MRLLTLKLTNFQGVKDFTLDTQGGHNVTVLGENGAGKTTLASAWNWLLFDKDSLNRKDFEIKTLTPDGKAVHGLEHEVEATIDLDGEALTLRKVYTEKWTKTRGSAEAVFSGHTTKHYIDGVPVSKRVYDDRIAGIAPEDVFKLLTNPRFFNDSLTWQKRREILLTVCGDVTDQDVIAGNPDLADLPKILGKKTVDQHKAIVKEQRVKVNRDLQQIPTRISEVNLGLPDISQISPAVLESDIAECRKMLEEKQAEKLRIEQGGEIAEKTKQLRQVESEIIRVEGLHNKEQLALSEEARNKLFAVKAARKELELDINGLERGIKELSGVKARHEAEMADLRADWAEVNAEELEYEQDDTCPTCGQALPEDQLQAAYEKALNAFNLAKAESLEEITIEGKANKEFVGRTAEQIAELEDHLTKGRQILADLKAEEERLQGQIVPVKPLGENPDYNKLAKEKANLEMEILALREGGQDEIQKLQADIDTFEMALEVYLDARRTLDQHARAKARIEDLKDDERRLAAEYEKLERQMYLCEEFIRTKVSMLDERLNSRFLLAHFKMFEEQVNGGIAECCETLYGGVPWSKGLNNGAQINAGIDIINTLSEHYGFSAPIFADNAESVTEIIPTKAQLIKLVVSAGDKKLRVEVEA